MIRANLQGETNRLPWRISYSHEINNSAGKQADIDLGWCTFKAIKRSVTQALLGVSAARVRASGFNRTHTGDRGSANTRKSIAGCLKFLTRPPLLAPAHIAQGPRLPPLHATTHRSTTRAPPAHIPRPHIFPLNACLLRLLRHASRRTQ